MMQVIIGIGLFLIGLIFYYRGKAQNAEAINENVDVKNSINEAERKNAERQGLMDSEAAKRDELEKARLEKEKDDSQDAIIDDLNKPSGN